jgi:hypothetical protein
MLKEARKDQNMKVLAVRVRAKTHENLGESVYKAVYAVTQVDSSKNIDSKDHFYLDYHSMQVIDVTSPREWTYTDNTETKQKKPFC